MDRDPNKFKHHVGDVWYTDKQVMCSYAGYYVGTSCWDPDFGGFEEPGSRESEYYETKEQAEKALTEMTYDRVCYENIHAYKMGLPNTPDAKPMSPADGFCNRREDKQHCTCWWDGAPCCNCRFDGGSIDGPST